MAEPVFRLKWKYRSRKQGAKNGAYKSRTGNSHGPTPKHPKRKHEMGVLPPMRVYLGAATPEMVEQFPMSKGKAKKAPVVART